MTDCTHPEHGHFGRCPGCGEEIECGTVYLVPLWDDGPSWVELRWRWPNLWAEIAAGIATAR